MYINLNIILCIVIDISNVITALILMESALWKAIQVNSHLQIEETTRGRDRGRGGGCGCGHSAQYNFPARSTTKFVS